MEILSEGGSLPECFKAARKGPLGHVRWTGVKRRSTSETGATVITSGGGATEILWEAGLLKPLLVSNRSCIVVSHSAQEQKGFSLTLIISVGAMSIGSGLRSGITEMSK